MTLLQPRHRSALIFIACLALFTLAVTVAAHFGLVSTSFVKTLGKTLCLCLAALAMDLIWGYAGILSLGHMAFFALGGYMIGMWLMYARTEEIVIASLANGGLPFKEFWRVSTRNVPVPVGKWFKFEVFWHRSKGSDGRFWAAVNGQKIVDKFGPNYGVNSNPIDRIMFLQLYSGASYPLEQWTDDVQIWSSFPSAKPGDPWYDGVYGPH